MIGYLLCAVGGFVVGCVVFGAMADAVQESQDFKHQVYVSDLKMRYEREAAELEARLRAAV